ncbi:HD-GYP domain-containing protein [Gordoniibacillus kamchatkensis]|uniref:HD-GYP domain-containing protein n=1 Tax=Gordoniibacillus kamchatkensis TaxID=1590651 RepID=UPI000A63D1BE|nr:HD-GYP domain-containing protein [Paenibacillus sp. VKM B-2647]
MIPIDNTWFIGRRLNNNIYSKQGSLLLPKNNILEARHLDLLRQHGIEIMAEDTELVIEALVDEAISEVQSIYEKIHHNSSQLSNQVIRHTVMPKIQELCFNNNLSNVILALTKKDHYTYRHCIGVAVISYLIGKWLGLKDEELNDLTVAGLLHDLGKTKIPDSILKKVGKLSAEEYSEMKRHTHFGYEMIGNLPGMTEQQALVALQHHEREDGSGYPFGVCGDKITHFCKIVTVADVFHTMVSERVYKNPVPLYQVFQEIYQRSFGLFDPIIVQCFITNVMNRMIGDSVLLSDGRVARIVMLHPDDLINPLVELQGEYCDLRQSKIKS